MKFTTLKTTVIAVMLGLGVSTANAGGIPVIDGAQIGNQIQTWVVEAQRWQQQIQQYKQDFENQKNQLLTQGQQLASMTGVRDIVGFMNEAKSVLEDVKNLSKWLGNTDSILKNGKEILGADLRKIFDSYGLTNLCNNSNLVQQKSCEGEIIIDVLKQEQNRRDLEKVNKRIDTIQGIAKRMEKAKDVKEAQDLSNAMQTQIALLNTDKIALDIARSNEELAKSKAEKQKQDEVKRINSNFKYEIK